jgi:hypothetical protein
VSAVRSETRAARRRAEANTETPARPRNRHSRVSHASLAAGSDEYEQRWQCVGGAKHRCSFDVAGDPRRRPSPSGSRGRRSRAAARMPSPLTPRAGASPAERASRRHTSDTLSMSKQVYGRATAPSDDHVSSAESQGFKPRSPSSHGALHGGNKPYHGSALPTELRGQKTCKSASHPRRTRGFASRPYCRDTARGAKIDTAEAPAGDDARLGERVHRGQV